MSSIPPDFNKNGFPPGDMGGYAVNEFAPHQPYGQYYDNSSYPVMNSNGQYAHQAVNHPYGHSYFSPEMHQITMDYAQPPKDRFAETFMNEAYQREYMLHATAPIPAESQGNVLANSHTNAHGGQNEQVVKASETPQAFPSVEKAFNQLTTAPATPMAPMLPVSPAVDNSNPQAVMSSEGLKPVPEIDDLSNSTTPDTEAPPTESNSPIQKGEPILSPIAIDQNRREEHIAPEEVKLTKADWLKASQMECSFSEVLSQSYFDPAPDTREVGSGPNTREFGTSPDTRLVGTAPDTREVGTGPETREFGTSPDICVVTIKEEDDAANEEVDETKSVVKTRRLIETDDEEDTRAEDFWNNPALESMSTKEKKKNTKMAESRRASNLEDVFKKGQAPSTSEANFSGPLYHHSFVDDNLEASGSEGEKELLKSKKEPRKRKVRGSLIMSNSKKRKPNKDKPSSRDTTEKIARLKEKKKSFRKASLEFKFEADLDYALKAFGQKYPAESINKIREYLDQKKALRKNPHYLRTPIDFSAVFPDQKDYRHCNYYRQRMTSKWKFPANTRRRAVAAPCAAPPFSLFGTLYTDLNATAHDVHENVKNWFGKSTNDIYMKSDAFVGPEPDENLAELERQFYKDKYGDTQMEQFLGVARNRIQTPVLTVKTKEDLENPNLKRILNSASITVVSGICEAAGIDKSLFTIEALSELKKDLMIDCLFQNPQTADNNFDSNGTKTWRTSASRTEKPFTWFVKYMHKRYEHCERYLSQMVGSKNFEATEAKILKKIVNEQKELLNMDREEKEFAESIDQSMYWTCFGTNIDLQSRETFAKQHEHLDKLSEFLRPRFDGNLLNMIGEDVLGINTVQVYSKPPGSRTAAHMENSLMASININLGPGECVWFAVPYEYWGKIEKMVEMRELKYHTQNYWPDEEELRAAGIPVQKFLQKEDEMVYVNTGCFHWVQSAGYCVNVSWNVGQPTGLQMSTAMIAAQHNLLKMHEAHIPICKIAWEIAKNKLFMDDDVMYDTVRSILIRTFADSSWYEEELAIKKKLMFKKEDLKFDMPPVIRCLQCGIEVFNVIRWYLGNDEISSTVLCRKCNAWPENTRLRYEAYTVVTSREELMKIMDGYKRHLPRAISEY